MKAPNYTPPRCIRCSEIYAGPRPCVEGGFCTTGDPNDARTIAMELVVRARTLQAAGQNMLALAEAVEQAVAAVDRGDVAPESLLEHPAVAEARRWMGHR